MIKLLFYALLSYPLSVKSTDICGLRCQNFKKINEVPIFTQIAKTTPPHTSTHTQLSNHTHIKL